MYTIDKNNNYELVVKKSKFMSKLYKVNSIKDVNDILKVIKKEYKDATHICFAYILENKEKCFDDGEPNGTAGFQILNVLKKENITNVLGIVIRYFGGIKLGVGGLSRSYFKATKECLEKCYLTEIIDEQEIILETSLSKIKLLNAITKDYEVINKIFDNNVSYRIRINKKYLNVFLSIVNKAHISYKIVTK